MDILLIILQRLSTDINVVTLKILVIVDTYFVKLTRARQENVKLTSSPTQVCML